ncbi:c-type cytochrome [Planctomicrobium sp. SH664]|uniref:c-type cytochrome n=1 Tax=Planctomicrobium sp. SH664 TaxID=3448125 RepID=UPI003F5CA1DC
MLLKLLNEAALSDHLKITAQATLSICRFPALHKEIKGAVPELLNRDGQPLPPLWELARKPGDPVQGRILFHTTAACMKCHQVNGLGLEVGTNLSEVGKSNSKEGLLQSVLYPSAQISPGYETWLIERTDGRHTAGLLIKESPEELQLREATAEVIAIPRQEIENRIQQPVSLMPSGIQRLLTTQELIDLVEYLATLQQRRR